jgi:3-dehydroshikimate dehydratase
MASTKLKVTQRGCYYAASILGGSPMEVTLTGFADEISSDLDVQLDVLASEGIQYLDLRGAWGKNVSVMTGEDIATIKALLDSRDVKVSSIGSPIGKIKVTDDFAAHLELMKRMIHLAKFFETPYIRIFSFIIPAGEEPLTHREEVMRRMKQLCVLAEQEGVVLLLENEKHVYGDIAERCLDILQVCESKSLVAAFDPANFIQCGVASIVDTFKLLQPYTSYMHVKDALKEGGSVVPSGEGDGDWQHLVAALSAQGYSGFMSLEPHLKAVGALEGRTNPELFVIASQALKKLLLEAGCSWK